MVDVFVIFQAALDPGFDDLVAEQGLVGGPRSQQRSALAVEIVGLALPIFGFLEVWQHVVPRPAAIAELSPVVEILRLAADIDHPVDRA
jgi:hypothetical protein